MLPIVAQFFACDRAVQNPADGKWTLTNPWHTVSMPPGVTGNFEQVEIWLWAQLTGGPGTFDLRIEMRNEGGSWVRRSPPTSQVFGGGLQVVEVAFRLTNVPFDSPGVYEFVLLAGWKEIGKTTIRVLPG